MRIIFYFFVLFFTFISTVKSETVKKGQQAYENNCKACHHLNRFTVGPSLVSIKKAYPEERLDYFLAWTKKPGKKNPKTIQMPAMAHVGTQSLIDIHEYILMITKGKKEWKPRHNFGAFKAPKITTPYVKRGHMPFASPASVGVVLNESIGLNWDTTIGKVRYAYLGTQNFFSGDNGQEKLKKHVLYLEKNENAWPFPQEEYQYIGYRLHHDLPELLYQFGNIHITEKIREGRVQKSFLREYLTKGISQNITLDFSHVGNVHLTSNKGKWVGNKLYLTAQESKHFWVEVVVL